MREGAPFRDAHEQVAASVREGTFSAARRRAAVGDVTQRSRKRRNDGNAEHTAVCRSAWPRPAAHLRPRPGEAEAILDLALELKEQSEAAAAARRDARALLREAFDAHARLVHRRDDASRRLGGPLTPDELQLSRGESLPDTARALSRLPRRARRAHARARRARGVGGVGDDPGDQRADGGRASVPGARRRADDSRSARLARRRARRVGRRRLERARVARRARGAARLRGGRRVAAGYEADRRDDGRDPREAVAAPTSSSPTRGSAWGRSTSA